MQVRPKTYQFNPWVWKIWRREWQSAPVFLPGESHGQRNLAGHIQFLGLHRVRHDWSNLAQHGSQLLHTGSSLFTAAVGSVFLVATRGIFSLSMPTLSGGVWDLVPRPEIEPRPPVLGVGSLSHWTTKEVPPPCWSLHVFQTSCLLVIQLPSFWTTHLLIMEFFS